MFNVILRLPPRYREIMKEEGYTFQSFDNNGDESNKIYFKYFLLRILPFDTET